jgi:DNA-binding transcriptional ArsR family regulator
MQTSTSGSAPSALTRQALELCWGAWSELGVSGWGRTHRDWVIDPEPLIIATSRLGRDDPRLRDESMDWCIRNWRYVSQTRLRNLLRSDMYATPETWGPYAATVNAHAGVRWPLASEERPHYQVTGRSMLRPLTDPSLLVLRMRAMFGVGARTEILRHLLLTPDSRLTAAEIASAVGYAKRGVSDECEILVQGGLLEVLALGNRFYYSLNRSRHLSRFVGPAAPTAPDWIALFRVVFSVLELAESSIEYSSQVHSVELHQTLKRIEPDLRALRLEGPSKAKGAEMLTSWSTWSNALLENLATGSWPSSD